MGLIDRLTDRALDEATAAHRDSVRRRQQLRDQLVAELTSYSKEIELTRIAYLRVEGAIFAQLSEVCDQKGIATLSGSLRSEQLELLGSTDAIASIRQASQAALDEASRLRQASLGFDPFQGLASRRSDPRRLRHTAEQARQQAESFDDAWAELRPLLDDSLELEAVLYLRGFRHEFRAILVR